MDSAAAVRPTPSAAPGDPCRFCQGLRGPVSAQPHERSHRVGDECFVLPSLGALVPGWTLVVPAEHETSSARLTSTRRSDLFSAAELVRERLGPGTVMFEHGAASPTSQTACTTAHAHLHVVPLPNVNLLDVSSTVPEPPGIWIPYDDMVDLSRHRGSDYFLLSTAPGQFLLKVLESPVSQFFRKRAAEAVGLASEWDWHTHPQYERVAATAAFLDHQFAAKR